MRIEIIRPNGDLRREVWDFALAIDLERARIYLDAYSFQTRETMRHRRWISQTHWTRLDRRGNNTENPPLPNDVEGEIKQVFADKLRALPIVC